jgi:dethiobiotin synthetase
MILFVTGTHTGIGKTLVTAALAHQLARAGRDVVALKPVMSGFDSGDLEKSDAAVLLAAQGIAPTMDSVARIAPYRFVAPVSPDVAAAREGRSIALDALVAFCSDADRPDQITLVEGIGGVMTPLAPRVTVLDWIATIGCPAVLVAGSYLGTLSHTLTAIAAMAARGVAPAALIVSESAEGPAPLADTVATIRREAAPIPVIALPRVVGPEPWRRALDLVAAMRLCD